MALEPLPEWAKDDLIQRTDVVETSWLNRLRFLLSGRFMVVSKTAMENVPGRVECQAFNVYYHPIFGHRKPQDMTGGAYEVGADVTSGGKEEVA